MLGFIQATLFYFQIAFFFLGEDLALLWSINHLSLLPMEVGLLGWTWTPDATSCLSALLVTSSIPGVPNGQCDGKVYDRRDGAFGHRSLLSTEWVSIRAPQDKTYRHDPGRFNHLPLQLSPCHMPGFSVLRQPVSQAQGQTFCLSRAMKQKESLQPEAELG